MAKKNDSLGDRMKGYEGVSRNFLTRRVPAIIRFQPPRAAQKDLQHDSGNALVSARH